jgi:hypothetical protein
MKGSNLNENPVPTYTERVRENEQAGLRLALRRRQYRNLSIEGATVIPSSSSSCSKDICRRVFKTSPIWSLEYSQRIVWKDIYVGEIQGPSRRSSYFAPFAPTLIKRKENFPHIEGNSDGIGCKVIYEEWLPNIMYEEILKYYPYMRRPLVIYDFATDPVWTSWYMGKILFSFLSSTRRILGEFWHII